MEVVEEIQPIQIWLPTLVSSLGFAEVAKDVHRAFDAWNGETRVYLVPGLSEVRRWQEGPDPRSWAVAVPAEHPERIDVFHVGANGFVWGPEAQSRFPGATVNGLLRVWLNAAQNGLAKFYVAPAAVSLPLPRIRGDRVLYRRQFIPCEPGPTFPVHVGEAKRTVELHWPRDGVPYDAVFPDAESAAAAVPLRPDENGLPYLVSEKDPSLKSVHTILRWDAPLTGLFSLGAGLDDTFNQELMVEIAQVSSDNSDVAMTRARSASAPHLFEGWTTRALEWFWPTVAKEGLENGLYAAEARFGIESLNIIDAMASAQWRRTMQTGVPIRRAWGGTGLFWALLLGDLERARSFRMCQRCGRTVLTGKSRYCGREDDERCHKERRATDKRRSRRGRKRREAPHSTKN